MVIIFLLPSPTLALPTLDGIANEGEWAGAETHTIVLNKGFELDLSIIYTESTAYYLAVVGKSLAGDINIEPSEPHDYFGLEFDNNYDDAIMGTVESPDDTIMVNYKENTAADMFMHSYKAFYDTEYGGTDDTVGKAGTDGDKLYFEFSKPMTSDDSKGYDFSLSQGMQYKIMVGFWDDQPPHSAIGYFNERVDNDQFIELSVGDVRSSIPTEIISLVVFISALSFAYIIIQKGTIGLNLKNLKDKLN